MLSIHRRQAGLTGSTTPGAYRGSTDSRARSGRAVASGTQLRVLPPGLPLSRVVLAEPLAVGADLMGQVCDFAVADGRPLRLEGGAPLALG